MGELDLPSVAQVIRLERQRISIHLIVVAVGDEEWGARSGDDRHERQDKAAV
jgi:hypothetical protein